MRGYLPKGFWAYVIRHPFSILYLARAGWSLRQEHWWRRAPFLPLPPREYWEFRLMTAFGATNPQMTAEAMVDAAKWSLRQRVGR